MTRQLKRLAIYSLLLGSPLCSYSATVTLDDAYNIAKEFLGARNGDMSGNVRLEPVYTAGSESKPLYYVFDVGDKEGFVIISGEDAASPILGYSFEGAYPMESQPYAMRWMMTGIESELKAAPDLQPGKSVSENKRLARVAAQKTAQKLLATASWSQEAPFNSMIPGHPLVGCVGTAMATIMKYHQWPESGTGSFDGVDFNVDYDWESMRTDNYRSGYSAAEGDAVAQLMYHSSKSIDTQYAMSGSSAYEVRVPAALSTYFGYDPGVSYKKRAEVSTQAAWDKMVMDEIDANRPVLYCGQDVTAGHAFVCDGYEGEFLHFNWGWGGSGNGYFRSTALNPTVSRTHHYNNLNTIIYNIKPASGDMAPWSPIHITADGNQAGIGSDMTDLGSGNSFTVRVGNLKNLSYSDFSGKIAVALCDATGKMKTLLSTPSNFSLQSMATLFNGFVDFRNCALPSSSTVDATDRVRVVTQSGDSSEWLPVAGELLTVNELEPNITVPQTFSVTFPDGVSGITINGEPSVIRGWNYAFNVVPDNPQESVVTVKANGYVLTPSNGYTYSIDNVRENQTVTVLVQNAADVREKRSIWVGTPGTLSSIISEEESGTIKELTLFGIIDARDFTFMRNSMRLTRLDLSGVTITANGSDQANAIPREAFRGVGTLTEVILPGSVNRLNNGCFRQSGITTITIPANVKTYEYNVFCSATKLRHIYVRRETAEFINWCVLSGVNTGAVTLHVPTERAVTNYKNAENWNSIANIVVESAPAKTDMMFAVMDNGEVQFECETLPGSVAKGTPVSFTARHIGDNDNNMQVYANSTLLTADESGMYHIAVDANTIIHFDLIPPMEANIKSPWKLTGKNGSVGLFTDAVNVIAGQDFTIRVNALEIPRDYDQFFWAAALTDVNGNIKEFISPVTSWTAGAADNHKFNVFCRVNDSEVREGNTIRIVTSPNKKQWGVVEAEGEGIVSAIPALNNMTPVYNINIPEVAAATVTGAVSTAVRGRDITLKIVPKSAANRVDMSINGEQVIKEATSVNYTFVAMEDMDFDIQVYDPKESGAVTYQVNGGSNELYKAVTAETVRARVIVTGKTYASDLSAAFTQSFAKNTIKKLDLSTLEIIADPTNSNNVANMLPSEMFWKSSSIDQSKPVLEEIILPNTVTRIGEGAFKNCEKLKEIRLPESLRPERVIVGYYASGSPKYGYPIGAACFQGCTSLTTIYIPGPPSTVNGRLVVCHFNPLVTTMDLADTPSYNLGHEVNGTYDASQTTIVVPEEYLSVYRTAYANNDYGNPWKALGYNIVSENPVYGVNFDPTRIKAEEGVDVSNMASFLAENVALESMTAEGKLKLLNPEVKCRVYDNGNVIEPAPDGSINLTFYNPAKNVSEAGNHNLKVDYTFDVQFHSTSALFTISDTEVKSDGSYRSEDLDMTEELSPILKDVAENSNVRFRVGFNSDHEKGLLARVMSGTLELAADAEGFYNVDITNSDRIIEIFAVPTEGATLNAEELAAVNPAEAAAITSIALSGEITPEELAHAMETFPALENLDLSDFEGTLPAGVFNGMTELTTVVLPQVEEIGASMFEGCSSLQSIDIPPTVNVIREDAFKDCSSLETIRLTSIESIGADAFSGCDNLTTITLLAGMSDGTAPAAVRSRGFSAPAIDSHAFDGINPNCIIVLDEGVTIPVSNGNYLTTSTALMTEELPDGTTIERDGRIYAAGGNIAFTAGCPLAIPHAFTLASDASVSLHAKAAEWTGIVVPFDVTEITDATGKRVNLSTAEEGAVIAEGSLLFALTADEAEMHSVTAIEANTPYLFRPEEEGDFIFSAEGIRIPATPSDIRVDGKDFSLHATYTRVERPASDSYLLEENGYAFVPSSYEEGETVILNPFEVYATSPVNANDIVINLPGNNRLGVGSETVDICDLSIRREGSSLVIYSPDKRTETICTVDGKVLCVVNLNAGMNTVEIPVSGIYIISNRKFRF